MIRNMDLGPTLGPMEESMQENGSIASDMEEERSSRLMDLKEKVFGSRTVELDGLMSQLLQIPKLLERPDSLCFYCKNHIYHI